MDNPLDRLTQYFIDFPGIGRRQAKRFAYHILRQHEGKIADFLQSMREARSRIRQCPISFQYFFEDGSGETCSPIERDTRRDATKLLIVEKDADIESIEKTKLFNGHYFVLGGLAPLLNTDIDKHLRMQELIRRVQKFSEKPLQEIIMAFPANPEGDRTVHIIREKLTDILPSSTTLTELGRGMSTGSEIEYIDSKTLEEALKNRHS